MLNGPSGHVTSVKRLETRLVHGELTAESCFIIAIKALRSFFTETPFGMGKEAKPRVHPCPHCLTGFQSSYKRDRHARAVTWSSATTSAATALALPSRRRAT